MKRRDFMKTTLGAASAVALPGVWSAQAQTATTGQVIFVFLRGGADALSLVPPTGTEMTQLQGLRPQEAVVGALPFASGIQLHPLLAPLVNDPGIKSNLNFVLHAGSVNTTLSHFEQMAYIETGDMTGGSRSGIFARAANSLAGRSTFAIGAAIPASLRGATGGASPIVLSDPAKLGAAYSAHSWKLGPSMTRAQRLGMYKKSSTEVGDANIDSAARTAQAKFDQIEAGSATTSSALMTAQGYSDDVYSLGKRLSLAAHMLSSAANPAFVVVDGDMGWDTHSQQFTNDLTQYRSFATKTDALGKNLAALKRDLVARGKWATTAVVVLSEFGRTLKQNGSQGTDHGRGGVMILMGGRIKPFSATTYLGARKWTFPTTVDVSTSLDVRYDYRLVLAEILQKNCGMTQASVASLFLNQVSLTSYLGVI